MQGELVKLSDVPDPDATDDALVVEAQQRFEIGRIIRRHGQWVITDFGMECLTWYYPIKRERLFEGEPEHGWVRHLADKRWIDDVGDLMDCLDDARRYHYPSRRPPPLRCPLPRKVRAPVPRQAVGPRLRFLILKRDSYRCRLCGVTADAGARLEVDHIHPVSKGGPTTEGNLWSLCASCNAGKGTDLL